MKSTMTAPTIPLYGRDHIPAAANAVTVRYHGQRCRLTRENGYWHNPRLSRPVRHLRDTVVALRRAIDRKVAR